MRKQPTKGQKDRIERELQAIEDFLADGQQRTFAEIREATGITADSVLNNRIYRLRNEHKVSMLPTPGHRRRQVYQKYLEPGELILPEVMAGYPDYYLQLGGWKCMPRVAA